MVSRYNRIFAKYNWSKQHVENFNAASEQFRNNSPYSFTRELDLPSKEYVYKMKLVPEIPDSLRFMLGDTLHALRSTLDHLAYALVENGSSKPESHTYFPVFDSAAGFSAGLRQRVPGLGRGCYEALERIQPYKGGFGHWAWQLHRLDVIDKHRLLLAVASVPVGRTVSPGEVRGVGVPKKMISPTGPLIHEMVFGHAPGTEILRAVEAGDEIGRFPATEDYEDVGFAFDIAIHEPEVIRGWPSYLLLQVLCSRVLGTINDLAYWL